MRGTSKAPPQYWRRQSVCIANAYQRQHQRQCESYRNYKQSTFLFTNLTCGRSITSGNTLTPSEIKVQVIQPKERQQILDFLQVHYYREEPLTTSSKLPKTGTEEEEFDISNIKHGTCLKATLNEEQQEKIVGAILAGPKGPNEADYLFREAFRAGPTKWGHILQFIACIERDAKIYKRFNAKNVLHLHVLGVDNAMRGRKIGCRLLLEIKELAKRLNYDILSADCTSFYSARLFERCGYECINQKYYRDYVDENGKQVFRPKPPHEVVKTFALKVDS